MQSCCDGIGKKVIPDLPTGAIIKSEKKMRVIMQCLSNLKQMHVVSMVKMRKSNLMTL